jgi:hypothetical protein
MAKDTSLAATEPKEEVAVVEAGAEAGQEIATKPGTVKVLHKREKGPDVVLTVITH